MGPTKDQPRTLERNAIFGMLAFFALTLLIGTFCDEGLAHALFSPGNVPATFVTTLGIYPFFSAVVLFLGVVFERVLHGGMGKVGKVVACLVAAALALVVSFIGAAALVDGDCLGGIFPNLIRNYPVIAGIDLVCVCPLFYLGFRLAANTEDELLLKRVLGLLAIMVAAFVFMRLTKNIFNRPRFRSVALGYPGVEFVPWYKISPDPSDLMAQYGLERGEFSSFPSGHAILSSSVIYILFSLSWIVPALRGREMQLCIGGFVFACVIMFTRMVLGAHYLSDVSMGAIVGLVFTLLYLFVQRRISESQQAA